MTAQVPDAIALDGQSHALAGVAPSREGAGLFDPTRHGLRPVAATTANWRGFVAHYAIEGDRLTLARLELSLGGRDLERVLGDEPLLGVRPTRVQRWPSDPSKAILDYASLGPVAFTGGLLLARDFIRELYVHMGFHPAWKFRTVVELLLEEGRVVARFDRSAAIASMRERLAANGVGQAPANASSDEIQKWIAETFRLDYRLGIGLGRG